MNSNEEAIKATTIRAASDLLSVGSVALADLHSTAKLNALSENSLLSAVWAWLEFETQQAFLSTITK